MSIARENGIDGLPGLLLSTLPARLAWAAYLRRQVPARMAKARVASHRDLGEFSEILVSDQRGSYRGGVLIGVAPGEREGLLDLVQSVRTFEGDEIKVVVADDLTGEYPNRSVRTDFPGVDFVRPKIPSGSSYCAFRTLQPALLHLIRTYEIPAVLKCDPDSLMIGAGAFDLALERFRSDAHLGILGRTVHGASREPADPRWAVWMAHPELRWSPAFRRLVQAAIKGVSHVNLAQAGAYFLASRAVIAALEQGFMPYRQPQWSLQVDDVIMGLIVQAAGFSIESFDEVDPIATDTDALPLDPEDLLQGGFKVVHSVRSSPAGMTEPAIRDFFRAARDEIQPTSAERALRP